MANGDFALLTQAVGQGLNLAGTLFASEQQAEDIEAGARRAELNQALAQREAELIRQQGRLEQQRLERQEDDIMGRTRASFAARGVDSRGTPTEVLADQAATLERRQAQQELETDIAAQGARFQARSARSRAQQARQRASAARTSGLIEGGTTLATGLSSLASQGAFEGLGGNSGPDLEGEISPQTGFT